MNIDLSEYIGKMVKVTLRNGMVIEGVVCPSSYDYKIFYHNNKSVKSFSKTGINEGRFGDENIISIEEIQPPSLPECEVIIRLEAKIEDLQGRIDDIKAKSVTPGFDRDKALRFIGDPVNNKKILPRIFYWGSTPQGYSYWRKLYDNLLNWGGISDRDIICIQGWIINSFKNEGVTPS